MMLDTEEQYVISSKVEKAIVLFLLLIEHHKCTQHFRKLTSLMPLVYKWIPPHRPSHAQLTLISPHIGKKGPCW